VILALVGEDAASQPLTFGRLPEPLDQHVRGPVEVIVVGDRPALVAEVHRRYLPNVILAWGQRSSSLVEPQHGARGSTPNAGSACDWSSYRSCVDIELVMQELVCQPARAISDRPWAPVAVQERCSGVQPVAETHERLGGVGQSP
jgi:uncharacterized protein YyaL (SSP411 family)